jgi:hypothetical protein
VIWLRDAVLVKLDAIKLDLTSIKLDLNAVRVSVNRLEKPVKPPEPTQGSPAADLTTESLIRDLRERIEVLERQEPPTQASLHSELTMARQIRDLRERVAHQAKGYLSLRAQVRGLHRQESVMVSTASGQGHRYNTSCRECGKTWPCPTMEIIDGD